MSGTIHLDDMRLFARVAEARSFTAAARALLMPKQTVSRRVAELEAALGVQLLLRTTRRLHLTDVGAAYATRCDEMLRVADDANRAVMDTRGDPRGTLRITADPLFGETFLPPLVADYARRFAHVSVDVTLTRRRVDVVEEGFDVAFRVGQVDDSRLSVNKLAPARVMYCASPRYIRDRGAPKTAADLARHDCLVVQSEGEAGRWPVPTKKGIGLIPVAGRLRFNSFAMAYAAAVAGLGIVLAPQFACEADIHRHRLVPVLHPRGIEVGAIWLAHPTQRYLAPRIRAFVDLALRSLR